MTSHGISFPFRTSERGVVVSSERAQVVNEQLRQLLLTQPGERVNRPSFGCGVQRLVFAGADAETIAAAEYVISTAIRRYLADLVQLDAVRVSLQETRIDIDILYTLLDSGEELAASFSQPLETVR